MASAQPTSSSAQACLRRLVLGTVIAVVLGEAPNSALPLLIMILAALIAVIPKQEHEVKKPLVRTGRVKRILLTAAICASLAPVASFLTMKIIFAETSLFVIYQIIIGASGFILFLLAPLWLTLGNLLLQPSKSFYNSAIWPRRARC